MIEKITDGTNVAKDVINTIKDGIDVANEALDLYNRVLDQVVPWKKFEEAMTELDKYRSDYSKESGDLLGEIKTFMMNGKEQHFLRIKR